jgi:S1-C subfamily serine protease
MTAPRHLWSGDWQKDSAELADELARRRAQHEDEPEATPAPRAPRAPRERAPLSERLPTVSVATRRRAAIGLGVAGVALVCVAVALAVASALSGTNQPAPTASSTHAWLGVQMTSSPAGGGATITTVDPGSPAAAAGLEPGDVITQINHQPIQSVGDVNAELAGLVPGNQLQIQFLRGPLGFGTLVTLSARPGTHP